PRRVSASASSRPTTFIVTSCPPAASPYACAKRCANSRCTCRRQTIEVKARDNLIAQMKRAALSISAARFICAMVKRALLSSLPREHDRRLFGGADVLEEAAHGGVLLDRNGGGVLDERACE